MNKTEARQTIKELSSNTSFFNNCDRPEWNMTQAEMREMLRNRMYFGEAETECIIAAIVIAGGLKK